MSRLTSGPIAVTHSRVQLVEGSWKKAALEVNEMKRDGAPDVFEERLFSFTASAEFSGMLIAGAFNPRIQASSNSPGIEGREYDKS